MFQALIPSLAFIVLIKFFLLLFQYRQYDSFSEESSWDMVDSDFEEYPKRPFDFPIEKNEQGIYLDRVPIVADTNLQKNETVDSFVKIGGEYINFFPLHALVHSTDEYYLTTILISFHIQSGIVFMDVLSLDEEFPTEDSYFSLLFSNGVQWDFLFVQNTENAYANSISLNCDQIKYLSDNKLDKWRIRRIVDGRFTIGALNFETRKFIYKPEIQATIQTMAKRVWECLH